MAVTAVVPPGAGYDDGGDGALRNAWLTPKKLDAGYKLFGRLVNKKYTSELNYMKTNK
jgi:hypothetical protein